MSNDKHFHMTSGRRFADTWRFANLKRTLSLMLVLVTLLGILPIPAAAADRSDIDNDLTLSGFSNYGYYNSPMLGGRAMVHKITVNFNGSPKTAFCGTFGGSLHMDYHFKPYKFGDKNYAHQPEDAAPYMIFTDYYYWLNDEDPDRNAWIQACVWVMRGKYETYKGLLSASVAEVQAGAFDDIIQAVANEAATLTGTPAATMFSNIKNGVIIPWLDGTITHYDYAVYRCTTDGRGQDLIVPLPPADDPPGDDEVWLRVKKVDSEGNALAGATFAVYGTSNTDGTPLASITTKADGSATKNFKLENDETSKTVWVKETQAPSGCKLKDDVWQVVMTSPANSTEATAALVSGGPITNPTDIPSEGTIKKVDQDGNGLAGATIRIYGSAFDQTPVDTTKITGENGEIKIQWTDPEEIDTYIKPGSYTVEEVAAPKGYRLVDNVEHIDLFEDGSKSGDIVFRNEKFRTVTLLKRSNGKPIAGATFDVTRDGKPVGSYTTGADGTFTLEGEGGTGVLPGYYTFTEVTPPPGCLLPANNVWTIHLFDNDDTQEHYQIVADNYEYPDIEIQKISKETGDGLAGATFEVRVNAQTIGTYKTGADGKIRITYAEYGEFLNPKGAESWTISVREISAPKGYLIDDKNWQEAEMHQGEKLKTFTFTDTRYPYIRILKRDRETGEPLPNTTFHVWIDGKDIGTHVTDNFGVITIDYDTYGRFLDENNFDNWTITVQETEMPDKYNKDKQDASGDYTLTQTLKWGQSYAEFVFKDTHFRDLRITKRDSSNTWTLADATFTLDSINLENEKGGPIHREGKTDANGQLTFKDLPNGTYRVTETVPPTGYSLADPNWQDVTITSYSDRVIDIEFLNAPEQGLLIRKLDATTKQNLAGVKFEIRYLGTADSSSGTTNDPMEKITDSNGLIYMPDCRRLSAST